MQIVGYKEYIDQVASEFPDVDKQAVARVVRHGLTMIGLFKKDNHDIFLNHNLKNFYFYFGDITNTPEKRWTAFNKKIRKKWRYLYILEKRKYSGYYYFAITEENYQRHLQGLHIPKVFLYKIIDEAKLYKLATRILQLEMEEEKWIKVEENYDSSKATLIETIVVKEYEENNTEHV